MKNFFSLLFLIGLIFPNFQAVAFDKTVRLAYSEGESFPFQINHEADPPGIAFEIISATAKDCNIKIQFLRLPNKRVQMFLKNGEIDGAFMFSYKKSRLVNGQYPMTGNQVDSRKRIAVLSYYLYKMKGGSVQFDGQKISGLNNKKIGANAGYSIVDDLSKMGYAVDEAKLTEHNFNKLSNGRIAAVAHQGLVADNFISSQGEKNFEKLPTPLKKKDYFLMFSHQFMQKNEIVAKKLWERIGAIRDKITQKVYPKYQQ